ncbi:putative 5-formyltetrahydrofolate cyclo-ligase [Pseudovibrio sp. Ad26]|nr:putative 5-formyltetrahydrofolate cyclo-ligase [Pseudovibrio sp. Ad26]
MRVVHAYCVPISDPILSGMRHSTEVRCVLTSQDTENADCKLAKRDVRKAGLAARATLSPVERIERSLDLVGYAGELGVEPGSIVAGFWPIRDEVDPRPLMDALAKTGCSLCLPVVVGDDLEFRRLDQDGALEPAGFGSMAPGPEAEVVHPNVVLVPLSAFDQDCNRIGYGKGFYDRALSELEKLTNLIAIGVAFAVQEVEEVPMEPHDRQLDGILTDHGLLRAGD